MGRQIRIFGIARQQMPFGEKDYWYNDHQHTLGDRSGHKCSPVRTGVFSPVGIACPITFDLLTIFDNDQRMPGRPCYQRLKGGPAKKK